MAIKKYKNERQKDRTRKLIKKIEERQKRPGLPKGRPVTPEDMEKLEKFFSRGVEKAIPLTDARKRSKKSN